jgi:hypothetical protein
MCDFRCVTGVFRSWFLHLSSCFYFGCKDKEYKINGVKSDLEFVWFLKDFFYRNNC